MLDRPLTVPTSRPAYALSVPESESRTLAGFIFDHVKSAGRVPPGRGLITLFASPAGSAELMQRPDAEVVAALYAEAARMLPGLRPATLETRVIRFPVGLPEARPEAVRACGPFLRRPTRRIDYAGDWTVLRPSSEGAICSGELVARRILGEKFSTGRAVRTAES